MHYNVDTTKESPSIISLCTGIRGLERGIERALGTKLRTVAYAEIESFIVANLIAGMEAGVLDPAPIWTNLKTFPWSNFHGKIHGIIGGYPCQPFSNAGKRGGAEDPRHLWPYIAEGIRAIRPLWCFFENVGGHLTLGYETVRRELQEMGYRVTEGIFTAQEVGAPHRRERLFILAVLADASINTMEKWEVGKGIWREFESASETELANSYCFRCNDWRIKKYSTKGCINAQRDVTAGGNENVAYANESRCKRREFNGAFNSKQWKGQPCESTTEFCEITMWPSRPGEPQYSWEEKRTVESGMGCTINGYKFTEDLLRAYGNGVVEQTSELAWKTLWEKMNNNG